MSTVSSISGSGATVSQLLQRLASLQERGGASATKAPPPQGGAPPGDFEDKFGQALTAAGVSDEDAAAIQDEIRSAIATALQNQDGSNGGKDAVKEAIDGTLEKYGIDPEEVRTQFDTLFGGPGGARGPGGPPPGGPPPGQEEDESSSTESSSSTSSSSDTESTDTWLAKLLSSDTSDSSTLKLLQSLLPLVDTTA